MIWEQKMESFKQHSQKAYKCSPKNFKSLKELEINPTNNTFSSHSLFGNILKNYLRFTPTLE